MVSNVHGMLRSADDGEPLESMLLVACINSSGSQDRGGGVDTYLDFSRCDYFVGH